MFIKVRRNFLLPVCVPETNEKYALLQNSNLRPAFQINNKNKNTPPSSHPARELYNKASIQIRLSTRKNALNNINIRFNYMCVRIYVCVYVYPCM